MKKFLKNLNKNSRGYTLIEMMISIGIFLVVITYGTASILNAYAINKKTQGTRSVLDSLSFAMDDMSRNIRVGSNYRCIISSSDLSNLGTAQNCSSGSGIAFEYSKGDIADNGDQWVYYISNNKLYKSTNGAASSVQMTPDDVSLDGNTSSFSVLGTSVGQQPFTQIKLIGTITNNNQVTPFSLQASVSQRLRND